MERRGDGEGVPQAELRPHRLALATRVREVRAGRKMPRRAEPAQLRRPALDRGEAPIGQQQQRGELEPLPGPHHERPRVVDRNVRLVDGQNELRPATARADRCDVGDQSRRKAPATPHERVVGNDDHVRGRRVAREPAGPPDLDARFVAGALERLGETRRRLIDRVDPHVSAREQMEPHRPWKR